MNFGGNQGQGQPSWNFGNTFKTPTTTATATAAPLSGFSFSVPATATAPVQPAAPSFGMFGQPAATAAAPAAPSTAVAATTAAAAPASSTSLLFNTLSQPSTATAAASTGAATTPKTIATTVQAVSGTAATATTTTTSFTSTSWTNASQPNAATSTTATMTFAQLEENISKSIEEFQEQETMFVNQSMQINSWDLVLMENSDKIIALRTYFEHLRGLQEELEQDMDFVVSQQKELEDLIEPLQKELDNMPISDDERKATYEIAENIDSSLKQMTNELKDIVESVNESNKEQDDNPLEKIGRILNVHMNSLQWIDRNVTQIENNLNQLSKIENAIVEDVTKLVN